MDCQMPQMDSYKVSMLIREHQQRTNKKQTPIVAVTADVVKGTKMKCLDAGMNDYLTKPINQFQLREVISKYIDNPNSNTVAPQD